MGRVLPGLQSTVRVDGVDAGVLSRRLVATEQSLEALLEHFVLEGVDERIYTTIGEGADDGHVVQRAREVERVAEVKRQEQTMVARVQRDRTHDHNAESLVDIADHLGLRLPADRAALALLAGGRDDDGPRLRCDLPAERVDDAGVADDADGERDEELEEEGGDTGHLLPLVAGEEHHAEAAVLAHGRRRRRRRHVEREAGDPRARHGDGRQPTLRVLVVVAVAERVDDGDVALQGDDEDVDGRRHQQAPQRHRVEPEAAHEVAPHARQVRARVDVRLGDDEHRREHVDEALVEHEHVDVLAAHRPEVEDDDDDEQVADDADRPDEVVDDRDDSPRRSQVLAAESIVIQ